LNATFSYRFQRLDLLADGRLRHTQNNSRIGKTRHFGDGSVSCRGKIARKFYRRDQRVFSLRFTG
jgi:hypothetical protein